jgi:hypothetical protein
MPEDPMYLPLHVGRAGMADIGYVGDDTGESISEKNANYCELTGLYWAWKNLRAEAVGLAHYRRHFTLDGVAARGLKGKWDCVLTSEQAYALLQKSEIVLPGKRKHYIENNYDHYVHAHKREAIEAAAICVKGMSPAYSDAWDRVMERTWAHLFNMFIMRYDRFNEYCEWLFGILGCIEGMIDTSLYTGREARVFGFVSERLLDVWIEANRLPYTEASVMYMESQNWAVKIGAFLGRKARAELENLRFGQSR